MSNCDRVYLIDNDPVFVAVATVLFKSAGIETVEHIANEEADISRVAKASGSMDLFVLGLNMGGLDGLAVLRLMAANKMKGQVAISSSEAPAIRDAALRLASLLGLKTAGELVRPLREPDIRTFLRNLAEEGSFRAPNTEPNAIFEGQLFPVFQPKFDGLSGEIVGGEALMRIRTPDGVLHAPVAHIEQATLAGTLADETLKFLDLVLAAMKSFREAGHFPVISVNVPAPVAEEPGFPSAFAAKVRKCGISPSQIMIELTESALPKEMARLVEVLTRLRMAGFGLALDDFGTGMANFDLLRTLPFNELKIDRSLAQAAASDALSAGIIETCATISRELNMTLVAEGIESEVQEKTLKRLGVNVFQGFLFGKGVPAREFLDKLKSNSTALGLDAVNA